MPCIIVTAPVCQAPMSWSNNEADLNMFAIVVTAPVCQAPMSWSNDEAP